MYDGTGWRVGNRSKRVSNIHPGDGPQDPKVCHPIGTGLGERRVLPSRPDKAQMILIIKRFLIKAGTA